MQTVFRLSHGPVQPEDVGIHTCKRYAVRPIRRDGAFLLPSMSAGTYGGFTAIARQFEESACMSVRLSLCVISSTCQQDRRGMPEGSRSDRDPRCRPFGSGVRKMKEVSTSAQARFQAADGGRGRGSDSGLEHV